MDEVSIAFAKLAGIQKPLIAVLAKEPHTASRLPYQNFTVADVGAYFTGVRDQLVILRARLPELYGDIADVDVEPGTKMTEPHPNTYSRTQTERLGRLIEQLFETRARFGTLQIVFNLAA